VKRRAVVSGIGCVSSLGCSADAFADGLLAGRSGIQPLTELNGYRFSNRCAARVTDFDPSRYVPPLKLRRIDPVGRLALAAAREALDQAGLVPQDEGDGRVGIVLGSFSAGVHATAEYLESYMRGGAAAAPALLFSNTVANASASICGLEYGLRGPNSTITQKESSGLAAVAMADHLVRRSKASAMIAGGADDIFVHFYRVHDWFGVMSPNDGGEAGSRPFDRTRNGFVMGEGGFLVLLEDEDMCRARGGRPLARVLATASSASASPVNVWPSESAALERAMRAALEKACLSPGHVDVVYASANGTALDAVEAQAIRAVFGDRDVAVTSIKGAIGEFAAASAASLAAAVLCGGRELVPPTLGVRELAGDCPVSVIPEARRLAGPVALVNGFASGGTNVSVLVEVQ
jgi:3-oxoacyl-[acyl-carrier-protein] synthase II